MSKTNLFSDHGRLHMAGTYMEDCNNEHFRLVGVSSYGLWRPEYLNTDTFKTLRDDWKMNCIRLAVYNVPPHGYLGENKDSFKKILFDAVDDATALDMYVIIDWHVLQEGNPLIYKEEAKDFFNELSAKYKDQGNVIYELCNEPNGPEGSWDNIYTYASEVIPVIRANDPDAVIMVGTPCWSQQVDKAAAKPLPFDNILYSLHFYAATHGERVRKPAEEALANGTPIAVNEFNICTCTGGGEIDMEQAELWKALMDKYMLTTIMWNLSNVDESSSILKATTTKTYGWSDDELNESGLWMKNWSKSL